MVMGREQSPPERPDSSRCTGRGRCGIHLLQLLKGKADILSGRAGPVLPDDPFGCNPVGSHIAVHALRLGDHLILSRSSRNHTVDIGVILQPGDRRFQSRGQHSGGLISLHLTAQNDHIQHPQGQARRGINRRSSTPGRSPRGCSSAIFHTAE